MPKYYRPERRPAVITGASSGIGAATAKVFADAGYPVALGARRIDKLDQLALSIRETGGEVVAVELDVTDPKSVKDFSLEVTSALGPIETVISNAGGLAPGTIHDVDSGRFARELDLNIMGAHRLVRAFVPAMVERRRGDIVFVSSDVAVRARPFMSSYAAGKWGLEGMAHAMQLELEGTGVRASIVRPGPTHSEMGNSWDPAEGADVLNAWVKFGMARHSHFLKPQALADAIAYIVSAPRGVHVSLMEVNPEAPLSDA